ncbi:WbqC family protein [Psychrobacillus psychrotolerans]
MSVAIMQPYFFPYLGYWQLINAVDQFVLYDNTVKFLYISSYSVL